MKSKFIYILFSILFLLTSCGDDAMEKGPGRDIGALHLSTQNLSPGDTIELSYKPENSSSASEVEGYYHYTIGSRTYPGGLILKSSGEVWKGKMVIPDSAQALAFIWKVDGKLDSNDNKGYVFELVGSEGERLKGSGASLGFFLSRYGQRYEIENDSVIDMVRKDLEAHPELEMKWDSRYGRMLFLADDESAESYAEERIAYYMEKDDLTEVGHITLGKFFYLKGDEKRNDSIQEIITKKFPKGEFVMNSYYGIFSEAENIEERGKVLREFDSIYKREGDDVRNRMLRSLAEEYAGKRDIDKFRSTIQRMNDTIVMAELYNSLAWNLAVNGDKLMDAAQFSKKSLKFIETGLMIPATRNYYKGQYSDTYAFILFQQDKIDEAIKYQKIAAELGDTELKQRYVKYLIANEEYEKTLERAETYIANSMATAQIKKYYQEAYSKVTGSDEGFEKELAALEKKGYEKSLSNVRKNMLNKEAPGFKLRDLQGDEIALNDLKGKTVILDFWATWCGPCKASFPGMQIAVDKYKDDDSVAFLFVNTMENGTSKSRHDNVSEFIQSNGYSFHVIMDQQLEGSRFFKVASDYQIEGIPTKIIIGPDNRLKFLKVGYGGNNEQMVQELDMMIELSKS